MGREKGYKLSPERIKRMQLAKERRKKGITKHLYVVEILVEEKMKQLFKKWNLDIEDFLFAVEGFGHTLEIILELREETIAFENVAKKAVEYLEKKNVREVGIRYTEDEKVILDETEQTGNVVFLKKIGSEYLVESYAQWGRHPLVE